MSQKWSVKSLVAYLKLKLDNDFLIQNITVVGELSNFNYHNNRHMYFTLKDESSRISCVMFQSQARLVNFSPKDGMKVNLKANVSIFESNGTLQLYVSEMHEEGVGDLAARFEALKKQLSDEGLFLENHKKSFKKYPKSIAVVSGKDSAALNDILTTLERRWPVAKLDVYTTLVQGPSAHLEIIDNLNRIDDFGYDAIILARGGGSIEDLWAFNEEALARVIYDLKTPIVSGIGHEIDFTISDFVSDLRAPTPTAAAELITPNITDVKVSMKNLENLFIERMNYKLNNSIQIIDAYASKPIFMHPELLTSTYTKELQKQTDLLKQYKEKVFNDISKYHDSSNILMKLLNDFIHKENLKLNTIETNLNNNIKNYKKNVDHKFLNQLQLLESYSPINTLKRGYSIVEDNEGVKTSVTDIDVNSEITVKLSDGSLKAKVTQKENNNGKL